jgi:hypothetical protein
MKPARAGWLYVSRPIASSANDIYSESGHSWWQFSSARGAAADLALQNAVSRLVFGFREIPEIRPWLEALGLRRNQ